MATNFGIYDEVEKPLTLQATSPKPGLAQDDAAQICSWIEPGRHCVLENIYRAVADGCNAATFHEKCDGQGPTVTVAYTRSGYIFGVYTSLSFQSDSAWVPDSKMFLFVIRKAGQIQYIKFPAQGPELKSPPGIYQDRSLGPTFGSQHVKEIQFFENTCDLNDDGTIQSNIRIQLTGLAFQTEGITSEDIGGNEFNLDDIRVFKVQVTEPSPSLVASTNSDGTVAPQVKPKPRDPPFDMGLEMSDERTRRPWRDDLDWDEKTKTELREFLLSFSPTASLKVPSVKILLTGEVASGKSSFINTVTAGLQTTTRLIPSFAITGEGAASQTRKYRSQRIRASRDEKPLHFEICDTMGMETADTIHKNDIANVVDGHCKDGYQFHSDVVHKIDKDKYRGSPSLKHKVHVGVLVISATSIHNNCLRKELIDQLKVAKSIFDARDIVTLVVLTKIDQVSSLVAEDIRTVFWSKHLKACVDETAQLIGISPKNVWLVKNYHEETQVNTYVDVLALEVMQQIISNADAFLSNYRDAKKNK